MDMIELSHKIVCSDQIARLEIKLTEEITSIDNTAGATRGQTQYLSTRTRQLWPDSAVHPRKMPFTDEFLHHNDPTRGLLHEDNRGIETLCRRRRLDPRSCHDP